jgi:hypothetical protein
MKDLTRRDCGKLQRGISGKNIDGDSVTCASNDDKSEHTFKLNDIVVVAEFGESIYTRNLADTELTIETKADHKTISGRMLYEFNFPGKELREN